MAETGKVYPVDSLIGRAVVSRATANKIGQIHDLIIEPIEGGLAGLSVKMTDQSPRYVEFSEIYSIGPDAIMINNDRSALAPENSPLKESPLAMNTVVGAEVITEGGKVLGQIANVFIHLVETPVMVYEARSSLLDKILGHALFFLASKGYAFSKGDARLVVENDTAEKAFNTLEALAAAHFGTPKEDDPVVIVRSRGY